MVFEQIKEVLDFGLFAKESEGTSIAFILYLASFIGLYKIFQAISDTIAFVHRHFFRQTAREFRQLKLNALTSAPRALKQSSEDQVWAVVIANKRGSAITQSLASDFKTLVFYLESVPSQRDVFGSVQTEGEATYVQINLNAPIEQLEAY